MNRNLTQDRCTESDYRQLFSSSSAELYELCFMLTADENLAKASFDAALARAVKEATSVFREWMWSWARRQIIQACIAAMRPKIRSAAHSVGPGQTADLALLVSDQGLASAEIPHRSLIKLDVLSRFVFVLRSLEGYSAHEIVLLLDVDLITLAAAYARARRDVWLEPSIPGGALVAEAASLKRQYKPRPVPPLRESVTHQGDRVPRRACHIRSAEAVGIEPLISGQT